jgi:hypothetical protein
MAKCGSQRSDPKKWRVLYRTAILERDRYAIAKELSDAQDAVVERTRELIPATGAEVDEEREALNDAMYMLRARRTALEHLADAA